MSSRELSTNVAPQHNATQSVVSLLRERKLHIDGVDPSMTERFISDHYGGDLNVPSGVHLMVFRQIVLRFNQDNMKFRLGGAYKDNQSEAREGRNTFGGGPDVMRELLATRFHCQPGVSPTGVITTNTPTSARSGMIEHVGNFRNAAIIGLFLDSYHNDSSVDIGLRVGVEFPDHGSKNQLISRDRRAEHTQEGTMERHFLYERCLRVHKFGRSKVENGTVDHYSAVLPAHTTRLGVLTKMADPVWTHTAEVFRRHPYIDENLFKEKFNELGGDRTTSGTKLMVPMGHPVGEAILETLRSIDAENKRTPEDPESAMRAVREFEVDGTMWLIVPKSIVDPIRTALQEEYKNHAQSKEFNNLENVCVTVNPLDDSAPGAANPQWRVTITLGILFAYMDTAGKPIQNGWLPSWVVESMLSGFSTSTQELPHGQEMLHDVKEAGKEGDQEAENRQGTLAKYNKQYGTVRDANRG